jgi:hypothetical protein
MAPVSQVAKMKTWILLLVLVVLAAAVVVRGQSQPKPVEFYWERPSCAHPVSLDLPGGWATPFDAGVRVWVCK